MKILRTSLLLLATIVHFTSSVSAKPFDDAIQAALNGPEKKKLKILDHHFNVKPIASVLKEGSKTTIIGHLSHHLRFRADDQIYYRVVKENGVIKEIKMDIERGGWAPIAAPIIAALATYYGGVPVPPDQVEKVGREIGQIVDKSWEGAAQFLITNIALRVK